MGRRMREFDWASHPLGPPENWPTALRMAVSLCLNSNFPTAIYWGPGLHVLYNDAWAPIPAERHPAALGRRAADLWSDIWADVGPELEQVMESGTGFARFETMLPMVRGGVARETWWNYSFTPIRNADNSIGGVFNQGNEVTDIVMARRARIAEVERWRVLFQQAPAPIALLRGREHVYEVVNDAYTALVGGRDLLGKSVKDALPEVDAQGYVEILDGVYRTGQPYIGTGITVKLQREPDAAPEEVVLDFIFQPARGITGEVEGIFVLATDVTKRTRAEAQLRISNWQLEEERARLKIMVEAEQRAREALRQLSENLEADIRRRTAQLSSALDQRKPTTKP
jgi:PAS domain-containing protein